MPCGFATQADWGLKANATRLYDEALEVLARDDSTAAQLQRAAVYFDLGGVHQVCIVCAIRLVRFHSHKNVLFQASGDHFAAVEHYDAGLDLLEAAPDQEANQDIESRLLMGRAISTNKIGPENIDAALDDFSASLGSRPTCRDTALSPISLFFF